MGNVTVYIPGGGTVVTGGPQNTRPGNAGRPVCYIASETGIKFALPFAPVETSHSGWAARHNSTDRTGRAPLVRFVGDSLPEASFDALLANEDGSDVETLVSNLKKLSTGAQRISISGLPDLEGQTWRLKSLSLNVSERTKMNKIRVATASLGFISASDVTLTTTALPKNTGPLTGGQSSPQKAPPAPTARTCVVKAGDTLWGIARAYYGAGEKWATIASANSGLIRDPNRIQPGWTLIIP